eukprot:scaffold2761_cov264-Chaetoceros_neogracile.AAC.2
MALEEETEPKSEINTTLVMEKDCADAGADAAHHAALVSGIRSSSLSDHSSQKRKRLPSEVENLTRNNHKKTTKPGVVQLYASDFDNSASNAIDIENIVSDSSRPKRRIKSVQRYSDTRYTHAQQMKLFKLTGKCGTGFLCPQCLTHLSYDINKCYSCGVGCCYQPGVGVVILRDREEITKFETIIRSRDVPIDVGPTDRNVYEIKNIIQSQTKRQIPSKKSKLNSGNNRKLIERTAIKNNLAPESSAVSRESAIEMLANAKATECEACMQLFLPSYLQRHRKRCHRLTPSLFGCSICPSLSFESMKSRNLHLVDSHPGAPLYLSDKEKDRTKLYLYDCPRCATSMTYGDLRDHLDNVHSQDINEIKDMVTCTCPFCLQGPDPKRSIFASTDLFLAHVKMHHKGCNVKGEKLKLGGNGIRKRNSKMDSASFVPLIEAGRGDSIPPSVGHTTSPSSPRSQEVYWYALSPEIAIDGAKKKGIYGITYKRGDLVEKIIDVIDSKIEGIRQKINLLPNRNTKKEGDDYSFENRLYIRGIRERKNKAEGEALEKFMYKDKCEEHQRWTDYQSRTKKKSPEQLELENLKTRPFLYFCPREKTVGTHHDKCPFPGCDLCNGWYATCIITNKEMYAVGGNVIKAIEMLQYEKKSSNFIPSRGFRIISEDDLPDDNHVAAKSTNAKVRVRTKGNGKAEMLILQELKYSLDFIRKFNEGLIK